MFYKIRFGKPLRGYKVLEGDGMYYISFPQRTRYFLFWKYTISILRPVPKIEGVVESLSDLEEVLKNFEKEVSAGIPTAKIEAFDEFLLKILRTEL